MSQAPPGHFGGYSQPPQYVASPLSRTPPALHILPGYPPSQQAPPNSTQLQPPPITGHSAFGSPSAAPNPRTSYAPSFSNFQERPVTPGEPDRSYTTSPPTSPILGPTTAYYNTPSSQLCPPTTSNPQNVPRTVFQNTSTLPIPPLHHSSAQASSYPPPYLQQEARSISRQRSNPQFPPYQPSALQRAETVPSQNSTTSQGYIELLRKKSMTFDPSVSLPRGWTAGIETLKLTDPAGMPPQNSSQSQQSSGQMRQPPNIVLTGTSPQIVVRNEEPEIKARDWKWMRNNFIGIRKSWARLGRGQFGTVYQVHSITDNKNYAMKVMDDNRRHETEIKTVLRLCARSHSERVHPHIVNVHDTFQVGRDGNDPPKLFIQMELCDGTLGGFLNLLALQRLDLQREDIFSILLQIAEGLRHCHSKNIIHRDLKPTNVLYSKIPCGCHRPIPDRARYLLTDFGFARAVESYGFSDDKRGTSGYRAPELLERNNFSRSTDIWAFGCVMMEVVSSGKRVAFMEDKDAHQYAERKGAVKLPQLNPQDNKLLDPKTLSFFNALLGRCLNIDSINRPSVEELLDYLKKGEI